MHYLDDGFRPPDRTFTECQIASSQATSSGMAADEMVYEHANGIAAIVEKLNHACLVVWPGPTFLRRMNNLLY
jgi:hypothetical protein